MRQRGFLAVVTITLAILLGVFAVSNVQSLDLIDRQGHELGTLSRRTGRLVGEVAALQHQIRQAHLEPVVPETRSTTSAPRARRSTVTSTPPGTGTPPTSTTSTTAPPPNGCPLPVCVTVSI